MLKKLLIEQEIEANNVLKKLVTIYNRSSAELKGIVTTIPDENIQINTLADIAYIQWQIRRYK
jgi:hypothetical protein